MRSVVFVSAVHDYFFASIINLPLIFCSAGSPGTTLAEPHTDPNTQQSKNNTANVVVQQHSRKPLKMDILMPETCWVSKK